MRRVIRLLATFMLVAIAAILVSRPAAADSPDPAPAPQGGGIDDCLACHGTPGLQTTLDSGETLYLSVDRILFRTSTHGRLGYACVQCHTNISGFPHDPISAATRRDFTLELYTSCTHCHEEKYTATIDSVHWKALAAGVKEAAVCTDCHGIHDIGPPDVPRTHIPETCRKCHSDIYDRYKESVHGEALIGEGNPDVPTCIDCHGVHHVMGPSTSPFHLFSPQVCIECHDDEPLMERYGISTDVKETYISDFHGTTVVLFENIAPDQETNKPVCIDCHGVHDIRKPDDPESTVIKENLLFTCQKCHPDATINFPTSWLSHYIPSPEHSPIVYFVVLFYQIMIPAVIGAMLVFVAVDGGRRLIDRIRERQNA